MAEVRNAAGRITLDLQAIQSASYRERGIARYSLDYTLALHRHAPAVFRQVLIRHDLPPAGGLEPLVTDGLVTAEADWSGPGGVFHVLSPFDLDVPIERLWPREALAAGARLVLTVYDLIPEMMPDVYLTDPGTRRRYRARRELVRSADHVMTLSLSAARDVQEHLGVPPERITVIGGACDDRFSPDPDREGARRRARAEVPGLEDRAVVYNGAVEPRKNMEGLIEAFSHLPAPLRESFQLVLVCRLIPGHRQHLQSVVERLGVADRVLLTGEVSDDCLVDIYRSAELAVVPSVAEGYGLPAVEAMGCGCPVIASGNTSLAELVHPDATFDPWSTEDISTAVERALTDDAFRSKLLDWSTRDRPSWADVAERASGVYERLCTDPRTGARSRPAGWRRRPAMAFVTPWPPAPTGVADYSARLVPHLAEHVDVDVYLDGDGAEADRSSGIAQYRADRFRSVAAARGGYDSVVVSMGNSEFHAGALRLTRVEGVRPVVLAHEVRFTDLYRHGEARGAVPEGYLAAAKAMYPGLPEEWLAEGWIDSPVAQKNGVLMAREVIGLSERFLVTSEYAANLARIEADPQHVSRIGVLPYVYPDIPDPLDRPEVTAEGRLLVASFGIVNSVKQPDILVEALYWLREAGDLDAELAFVGPAGPAERNAIAAAAAAHGLQGLVTVTGHADDRTYRSYLRRAAVAVQLRSASNGEVSGAVADCLTHGVPTITSAIGAAQSLPDFTRKVSATVNAPDLAATLRDVLMDVGWRTRASAAGLDYARSLTFAGSAAQLVEMLGLRCG
ncbi:MAG TPA: glycosyltransferase [Acidimicrobiales bacterium]|nr:glycosyltransferase [Acidimicrobiales bacterium]